MLNPTPSPVASQYRNAKKVIGTYQLIDRAILAELKEMIKLKTISVTELRIITASWSVNTLFTVPCYKTIRPLLTHHFTRSIVESTLAQFAPIIDPHLRKSPKRDNRKVPVSVCRAMARCSSAVQIGLLLMTCSQNSAMQEYRYILGQKWMSAALGVSRQAIQQALKELCSEAYLERSTVMRKGRYQYRLGPKLKPSASQ